MVFRKSGLLQEVVTRGPSPVYRFSNLQSDVLFLEEQKSIVAHESVVGKWQKKEHLIQLLHVSSAASPESGLLSDWSKNKSL